jgi:hypothetical protein
MKKEKKVVYGIEITKPWSSEMYAHNEEVAEVVREEVLAMWNASLKGDAHAYGVDLESFEEFDWDQASGATRNIQTAITCYGFGFGYTIGRVAARVEQELENAPLYRLNQIAKDLGLELEKEFIGFN